MILFCNFLPVGGNKVHGPYASILRECIMRYLIGTFSISHDVGHSSMMVFFVMEIVQLQTYCFELLLQKLNLFFFLWIIRVCLLALLDSTMVIATFV